MRLVRLTLFVLLMLATAISPARAQAPVQLQITAERVWLRAQPSLLGATQTLAERGQRFNVLERTSDSAWLKLGSDTSVAGWVLRDLGDVIGTLGAVPVTRDAYGAAGGGGGAVPMPVYIPAMSPRMQQLYQRGLAAGRDPNTFTVVGDCNSEPSVYLGRLASGRFALPGEHAYLQGIVTRYNSSFSRISLAARGGFGTKPMFDPAWSDPFFCKVKEGEGPFPCELRFSNASVVFIDLGTGDQYAWQEFEKHYIALIDHALDKNVVPVLVTKADDLEAAAGAPSGFINAVIRKLAARYQVPLLDFAVAAQTLDNNGLREEPGPDFHHTEAGENLHVLTTLQTLHALTYGISGIASPRTAAPAPAAVAPAASASVAETATFTVRAPANIRAAAATTAAIVGSAAAGQSYRIIETSADAQWVRVDLAGAASAWIFAALGSQSRVAAAASAAPLATPAAAAPIAAPATVRSGIFVPDVPVNLRAAPGLTAEIIGAARPGESLDITGASDDQAWLRTRAGAWVFAALGQFNTQAGAVSPPVAPVDPAPKADAGGDDVFTVSVAAANIRSTPSASAVLQGRALRGESFRILEYSADRKWVRIGDERWVYIG